MINQKYRQLLLPNTIAKKIAKALILELYQALYLYPAYLNIKNLNLSFIVKTILSVVL